MIACVVLYACNNTEPPTEIVQKNPPKESSGNNSANPVKPKETQQTSASSFDVKQTNKPAKTFTKNAPTGNSQVNSSLNESEIATKTALLPNDLREQFNTVVAKENYSMPVNNAPATITTKKGTAITINTSDLVTTSGKAVTAPVEIKVMEMKNGFDMLAMHSPTISDNRILESGGSWYIDATSNGEAVKLKDGKSFRLESTAEMKPGYSLFYGEKTASGIINWKPTNTNFTQTEKVYTERVGLVNGVENYYRNRGLKVNWDNQGANPFGDYAYDNLSGNYFSYRVEYNGKSVLCSEVWEFDKTTLVRKSIKGKGVHVKNIGNDTYYEDLTDAQKKYLLALLEDAECIDRCRVFEKNLKTPITYEFIVEKDDRLLQFVMDSIVITGDCKTLPVEMKKIITQKINKFCKANYNKMYNAYLVQKENIKLSNEMNKNTKMFTEVNNFGWINCDRFYSNPAEKILCKTNIQNKEQSKRLSVYMVFRNINSLIPANADAQGNYSFNNIPVGEDVMAVALGSDGTNSFFGNTGYTKVQKDVPLEFSIAKVSNEELKDRLVKLKSLQ